MINKNLKILVRGAGDIATGIIWYLKKSNFKVLCTEIDKPTTIRRSVAFSEAVYNKETIVEGIKCKRFLNIEDAIKNINEDYVPLIIDENINCINIYKPDIIIDSILAKKNLGTNINMAEVVIGIGPGFTAKVDCHYAIETMRGHNLSHIYEDGSPIKNTGIPGNIEGFTTERVIHSNENGKIYNLKKISDIVKKGEVIATIKNNTGEFDVLASINGVLRGIIRDGFNVYKGLKIADIDPRINEVENCFTISDKARNIAGAVLLCINMHFNK